MKNMRLGEKNSALPLREERRGEERRGERN
jgi:hypothetical protein